MPTPLSANQLVAYNLMRIRKTLGLSQEQAAQRLEPFLGTLWSKAVYSAAERSYHGSRIRQFTADDLVAFALAFGVPVAYFFLPPRPEDRAPGAIVRSGDVDVSWPALFEVMLGGAYRGTMLHRALELPDREKPALADSELESPSLLDVIASSGRTISRQQNQLAADPALAGDVEELLARNSQSLRPAEESEVQPVVAAIVTSERGVLVGRRNDGKPPWTFIAGEQEPGELPQHTAIREVKEEAALRIETGHIIGERVHPKTHRRMIYMAATPTHGTEVFVGDEEELAEVRWIGLAEADELLPGMFEPVREHLAWELGGL